MKYKVGPDAPGYFRRIKEHAKYMASVEGVTDPVERYEMYLDWLATHLSWPPTMFLKRVRMRTASRKELDDLERAIIGAATSIDPKKDENSDGG